MDIEGSWVNQNGSTVEFSEGEDGALNGVYRSSKGRSASGKAYPLSGRRNGEVLSFLVDWRDADENLSSITSFTGRIGTNREGEPIIHTVWVLVRQWENEERTKPPACGTRSSRTRTCSHAFSSTRGSRPPPPVAARATPKKLLKALRNATSDS